MRSEIGDNTRPPPPLAVAHGEERESRPGEREITRGERERRGAARRERRERRGKEREREGREVAQGERESTARASGLWEFSAELRFRLMMRD